MEGNTEFLFSALGAVTALLMGIVAYFAKTLSAFKDMVLKDYIPRHEVNQTTSEFRREIKEMRSDFDRQMSNMTAHVNVRFDELVGIITKKS
ncbi:hypothetical protein [uncultured Roseibium sp.]|uniref:hypothetical protein n=1 Tax=uncultured Roseibium sp. TaxID=1936171 RepID=UPI00262BB073|nr:hypothetical protein [uncultured Roseibium sp.]